MDKHIELKQKLKSKGFEQVSFNTFKLDETLVKVYDDAHVKVNEVLYAGLDVCERVEEKLQIK